MIRRYVPGLALTLCALITGCTTPLGPSGSSKARIHSVEGTADVQRGGEWQPARLWQKLSSGDSARTGGSGKIDFNLGKYGGVLTLMPDSAIRFEQLGPATPGSPVVAVIELAKGRVVGDTLKLPPNTRIQVRTSSGVHEIP